MFDTIAPLILASSSPRRKQMLSQLGIIFKSISAEIVETPHMGEMPETFAQRMAVGKAQDVAGKHPGYWTIGADTVITLDGKTILGKPADINDAFAILQQLAGKEHMVITAFCICDPNNDIQVSATEMTRVKFIEANETFLHAYIATGEPMDKAGAYGIQGIGSVLVDQINGSCSNVIGLPLSKLISRLVTLQIIRPAC